jgi:hypothetical protein
LVTTSELHAAVTQLEKSMELRDNIYRFNQVSDSLMKTRIQQRDYPKDKGIQKDIESLTKEKEKLQKAIEKR